eukprot:363759-Chlamydomonas_euryale.AAC.19
MTNFTHSDSHCSSGRCCSTASEYSMVDRLCASRPPPLPLPPPRRRRAGTALPPNNSVARAETSSAEIHGAGGTSRSFAHPHTVLASSWAEKIGRLDIVATNSRSPSPGGGAHRSRASAHSVIDTSGGAARPASAAATSASSKRVRRSGGGMHCNCASECSTSATPCGVTPDGSASDSADRYRAAQSCRSDCMRRRATAQISSASACIDTPVTTSEPLSPEPRGRIAWSAAVINRIVVGLSTGTPRRTTEPSTALSSRSRIPRAPRSASRTNARARCAADENFLREPPAWCAAPASTALESTFVRPFR